MATDGTDQSFCSSVSFLPGIHKSTLVFVKTGFWLILLLTE
jgi:hypothetical protein